ncbi:MAG: flagellar export chaperone FliS [Kangiellaceae bacterium]|nr:flagellar export chaperone FliS [Kangiellaceae bacterium]
MGLTGALAYNNVSATSGVEDADPHMLIQMLIDGAIEKINKAKYFMSENKVAQKGQHISWAISIINGLQASLDHDKGGEISSNLNALYEFSTTTLLNANIENDVDKLDSVLNVMNNIREAWQGIREQAVNNSNS